MKKVQLGGNKKGSLVRDYALVDDDDFEEVNGRSWYLQSAGYAASHLSRKEGGRGIFMHRLVMKAQNGFVVDHKDFNTLNNQKNNLRLVKQFQNCSNRSGLQTNNTSGYHGISWYKANQKWRARIHFRGKEFHLGYFNSKEEASISYKENAIEIFGEFLGKQIQ